MQAGFALVRRAGQCGPGISRWQPIRGSAGLQAHPRDCMRLMCPLALPRVAGRARPSRDLAAHMGPTWVPAAAARRRLPPSQICAAHIRKKNNANILLCNAIDTMVVTVFYYLLGFGIGFGTDAEVSGWLAALRQEGGGVRGGGGGGGGTSTPPASRPQGTPGSERQPPRLA
jgi:hypothetical protein